MVDGFGIEVIDDLSDGWVADVLVDECGVGMEVVEGRIGEVVDDGDFFAAVD